LRYLASLALCCCVFALAQESAPIQGGRVADEQLPNFESKVDLVLVPVVVRDRHGQAVGHLTKDDFQIFEKGRREAIASFSAIERPRNVLKNNANAAPPAAADSEPARSAGKNDSPKRSFIYLFDDLNIRFAAMADVRAAAVRHFESSLAAGDQAAIYTFSGNPTLDFTSDREKLQSAVSKLRWWPPAGRGEMQCPDVSYYIADLILVKGDGQALEGLTQHTAECAHVPPDVARYIALAAANRELIIGVHDTQVALRTLSRAIRRLAGMPGERSIVLASPGFFAQTPEAVAATAQVLTLAAKSKVAISGLSVHGVITAEAEDITARKPPNQLWLRYELENARADGDVMKDLAEGTGGTFFHNNNNLREGFERVTAAPEFSYVIGFSPAELKTDGKFHSLKVLLPAGKGVTIEARRGYYALKTDSKDRGMAADLDDAVFSQDQSLDIPVVLQTGYSKPNSGADAKVLVVAKIDAASLHFQKAAGRNRDSLNVVAALFDLNGGYVTGAVKTVNLKFLDETLKQKEPAITLNWEFAVKPATYVVRLVIRELQGKAMTTLNRTVKIL
jgi:VWFA-related protein